MFDMLMADTILKTWMLLCDIRYVTSSLLPCCLEKCGGTDPELDNVEVSVALNLLSAAAMEENEATLTPCEFDVQIVCRSRPKMRRH